MRFEALMIESMWSTANDLNILRIIKIWLYKLLETFYRGLKLILFSMTKSTDLFSYSSSYTNKMYYKIDVLL
jgi:hypothetical protein